MRYPIHVLVCWILIILLVSDDSQGKEELKNKNSDLEKNLHSVYVTSTGDVSALFL